MKTALIVDDSRLARLTLKRLIVKHDIEVFEADSVEEARLWLEHNTNPDVIFLDIMMPQIDGYEGLSLIRGDEKTKNVPIIMYSGDVSESSRAKAKDGGANGFLPKPADNARVEHLISTLSKNKQQQAPRQAVSIEREPEEVLAPSQQSVEAAEQPLRVEVDEMLRAQIQHLAFRLEQMERKNDQLSKEEQNKKNSEIQRDLTFVQRQLTNADNKIKVSMYTASAALVAAIIALIIALMF